MISIAKKGENWAIVIKKEKEEYPLVLNEKLSYIKARYVHITCQIKNHTNPQKVSDYYFEKAKTRWNKIYKN